MPQAPYISVIVPVYNVERYVKVCIDSILAQTFQDFEIIIVDDASPDNSYKICTELYGDNEKVRIIRHEKNQGQGIARNTGMSVARGKYLCFVDSDDLIFVTAFEKFYNIAEKINAEVVRFTGHMMTHQETPEPVNMDKEFKVQWLNSYYDEFLDENISKRLTRNWGECKENLAVWSCFYNREFLEANNIKFEPIVTLEDGLFIFQCLCLAKKYYLVRDIFYVYRKHKGSTMTLCSIPRLESAIKAFFIAGIKMNAILDNIPEFATDRLAREQHIGNLLKGIFNSHIAKFCADPEWREELDRVIYEKFLPKFAENTMLVKFFLNELIELQIAKTPAISVIVPVHNVERYIIICINSILQQTFKDFEIIIVDDFSTDDSYKICRSAYGDHKKIRIIRHEKNMGLGSARNTGIANSRGKYIYFVDSDDALLPNALEVLYQTAENTGADIVHTSCYYETYQDDDQPIKLYDSQISKEPYNKVGFLDKNIRYRLEKCWRCWDSEDGIRPMAWLHFCRRDIFARLPLRFEPIISEDELFSFELFCYIEKIFVIDEALYVYRNRQGSIMRSYHQKRLTDGIAGMRRCAEKIHSILNDFPEFSGNALLQEYFIYKVFENFLGNHITPFYKNGLNKELNASITTALEPIFKENTTLAKYFFNASNYFKVQLDNSNRNVQQLYKGYQSLAKKNQSLTQNHQRMSLFLQEQAAILKLFDEMSTDAKKIFLVGTPRHGNIGDQAIVFSEYIVLKKFFPSYQIIDVPYPYLTGELSEIFYGLGFQKYVQPYDLIVMHGGGNLGNLWVNEEIFRRSVIEKFHDNKIIIFPQSIHFTYDADGQNQLVISKQIYNAHPDLHLMLRDENSFNLANEIFPEINTYLLPDVVTVLFGILDKVDVVREGVLFVLRHDKEKVRDDSTVQRLQEFLARQNIPFSVIDTVINEIIYKENREQKVLDVLMKIRQSRLVITDRFHGVVFSYVTRTPVMAFKSFDTKISSGIKWFKDIPSIFYGEGKNFADMENFITQSYNQTLPAQIDKNFASKFAETLNAITATRGGYQTSRLIISSSLTTWTLWTMRLFIGTPFKVHGKNSSTRRQNFLLNTAKIFQRRQKILRLSQCFATSCQ